MKDNPLKKLETLGQSIWLNYHRNDMFLRSELRQLIDDDGVRGITSNPSILEKTITERRIYDKEIRYLASNKKEVKEIYETLHLRDAQEAADEFKSLYKNTDGKDGYVSLDINPHLAYNTSGTIEEARRVWTIVNRPNIFIKVPATEEGLRAIQQLISEGINVNATLLFGLPRYRQVAEAYCDGIKTRIDQGKPVKHIASVASFYLSHIDSVIDPIENDFVALGGEQVHFATHLRGQVAISTAKIAYTIYKEIFESEQFAKLALQGATPQRLVWASTGIRDNDYSDIKYIEAIIGENTVNLMSPETMYAYRKNGKPALQIEDNIKRACWVMSELTELGIDIDNITKKLENDSVKKFIKTYDKMMETLTNKTLEKEINSKFTLLPEKFFEIINHEGVVSIVSWGNEEPHIVNTWNSYLNLTNDERILIPAAGMHRIEEDVKHNNKVKLTLGSKEVRGLSGLGAGFIIEGTANFLTNGKDYDMMKEKFSFLSRVLEISIVTINQTL